MSQFHRLENESYQAWLERLVNLEAPADVRADVRALLQAQVQQTTAPPAGKYFLQFIMPQRITNYFCSLYYSIAYLDEIKIISVVFPATNKEDGPDVREVVLRNQLEFRDYCQLENGNLSINNRTIKNFVDLIDGHTYLMDGGVWKAVTDGKRRQQAEDTLLERETTLTVKSTFEGQNVHMHHNYIIEETGSRRAEYDGLVQIGGATIPNSKVILVECQFNPPIKKIDAILKKIAIFRSHIPYSDHFRTVTDVQAVLGGRIWSPEVIALCKQHNIWRVAPNGYRYTLHRTFFTLCKRMFK